MDMEKGEGRTSAWGAKSEYHRYLLFVEFWLIRFSPLVHIGDLLHGVGLHHGYDQGCELARQVDDR